MKSARTRTLEANALARAHREAGDVELASYLYAHSLEWEESVEARLGLAYAHACAGRMEAALEECSKAEAADPGDGRPANDRGVYKMQMGEDEAALPCFEKALAAERNPERQHPYYNLGRIHERRKDFTAALEFYRLALKEDPDFQAARKAAGRVRRRGELA